MANVKTSRVDVLVADIGGTNARFGVSRGMSHALDHIETLSVQDFPTIEGAVDRYVTQLGKDRPRAACFAVACHARDDTVTLTNSPWRFSKRAFAARFGFDRFAVANDFEALAACVPLLQSSQLEVVRSGTILPRDQKLVIGPGTGLGVAGLAPAGEDDWAVISGDGGHIAFGPGNPREDRLLCDLRKRFGRVSAERLLSGDGLVNIYRFLALDSTGREVEKSAVEITQRAVEGSDPLAIETALLFLELLGAVAGDLALVFGARGGVYIGGGITPRLKPLLLQSRLVPRFLEKGRVSDLITPVPIYIIIEKRAGLIGARAHFDREFP